MKGARALASALLILAGICLLPAVSAAESEQSPPETTTTYPSEPSAPAPEPAPASEDGTRGVEQTGPTQDAASGKQAVVQEQAAPEGASDAEQAEPAGGRDSSPRARASATATVTMGDFFFSPASVSVAVGDLVTWRNTGKEPHNAVADDGSFDTGTITAGGSASRTFPKPGTFSYICTIHPSMKGTVRAVSSGGGGGTAGAGGTAGPGSGSGLSEEEAVATPDAAGDSNTLPMSGLAAGTLALVGLALVASGLFVGRWGRKAAGSGAGGPLRPF